MLLNRTDITSGWGPHGKRVLRLLAANGPMSRERLHRLSGLHRNLLGDTVRRLIDDGLVRSGAPQVRGRGRPRTPVTLDLSRRYILGVAIEPGAVRTCKVNLSREIVGEPIAVPVKADVLGIAAETIRKLADADALAIGVSITGVIDPERQLVLESSSVASAPADLSPLREAPDDIPLVIENDLHALAMHWQMHYGARRDEDVLLVCLDDGAMGAALLVQGTPHSGCVHAANEIGHTCLAVDTPTCYCGRRGCLERIFDSAYARALDGSTMGLKERFAACGRMDEAALRILYLTSCGIANAVNLMKPHRLVLVSPFAKHADFRTLLAGAIEGEMLASLRERVAIDWWREPTQAPAVVAACPALAFVLGEQSASPAALRRVAAARN